MRLISPGTFSSNIVEQLFYVWSTDIEPNSEDHTFKLVHRDPNRVPTVPVVGLLQDNLLFTARTSTFTVEPARRLMTSYY